ncbi:uncharacterized protein [Halyomorpha halys]|uniref:uncharacterized protein n=1 Tax=Halyomorpha halys TaxID=286706 RepID=UPI0006D4C746|nr:uncharacterized protein LOC106682675 [Halyomorpha halys]
MTMDIRRRMVGDSGPYTEAEPPVKPAAKRSFDVAFLMAPDDSSKKRHHDELKEQLRLVTSNSLMYQPPEEKRFPEIGLLMPSPKDEFPKSAFTKVNKDNVSPGPAISPIPTEYQRVSPELSPNSRSPTYYPKYVPKPYFQEKLSPDLEKSSTSKRFPDMVPYGGLTMAYPFPAVIPPAPPALLTAANVTALLPTSLAALTLPAQNVCAKCNISFRMTSDLVYHMRSQHKSDHHSADSSRRRREQDKLRCPVCNESFRERHHLTRHMTAHQDKDGDKDVDEEESPLRRRLTK